MDTSQEAKGTRPRMRQWTEGKVGRAAEWTGQICGSEDDGEGLEVTGMVRGFKMARRMSEDVGDIQTSEELDA